MFITDQILKKKILINYSALKEQFIRGIKNTMKGTNTRNREFYTRGIKDVCSITRRSDQNIDVTKVRKFDFPDKNFWLSR